MNQRISEIRNRLNLTQEEFAKRISFGRSAISLIEGGNRAVNDKFIKLVCDEFNVSEEWLRTGEGEMFRTESDLLELLGAQLDNLDEFDKRLIIEYVKLEPKHKKIFKDFIKKMTT